jgi:hypothetical protein
MDWVSPREKEVLLWEARALSVFLEYDSETDANYAEVHRN